MAASIAFEQPSIQKAWDAFLKHIPVLLVIWVGSIALAVVGLAVSMLIVMAVGSLGGSSDSAFSLGAILGQLTQIPFSVLSSLLSVLMVAIPAVYYERGDVVTIGAALALLRERFWRYVLAGLFFSIVMTIGFALMRSAWPGRGPRHAGVCEPDFCHRDEHRRGVFPSIPGGVPLRERHEFCGA
jgi:hypothetical protein